MYSPCRLFFTGILVDSKSSNEGIKSAGLGAGISVSVGTTPVSTIEASAVADGEIVVPDGLGVLVDEVLPVSVLALFVKVPETTGEDTLELLTVTGAVAVLVTAVDEDAVAVNELGGGGVGNSLGSIEVRGIAGGLGELGETAEDDTLVVREGGTVVVIAAGVETVVDKAVAVDHAGSLEPVPLVNGSLDVRLLDIIADVVGNGGRKVEVQLCSGVK